MKFLRVFTVFCVACQVTNCLRSRSPRRESAAVEHQYRIIRGERAPEGIAPYQVSLQELNGKPICSGSILNRSWILTAAHCLKESVPNKIQILSGSNKLKGKTYHCPDHFIIHPNYNIPEKLHNDIGLIHLSHPLKYNSRTRPIEIATQPLTPGRKLMIAGWGRTNAFIIKDSPHLLMGIVNYVPPKKCKELLPYAPEYDPLGHICTLSKQAAVCMGDSGGPVVTVPDKKLVGLVSFVQKPCGSGHPDAHTNVMYYRDWIKKNMK